MSRKSIIALAVALSGLATTYAIPFTLIPRAPGSASAVPSASAAPSASAPAVHSTTASVGAVSAQAPAKSNVPTVGSIAPPPPPQPTFPVQVEVGTSQFNVGDADSSGFEDLWKAVCGPAGCDGGTPQTFNYNGIEGGFESPLTGQFVMTGFANGDQFSIDAMLDVMNGAFQATKQCNTQPAEQCAGISGRSADPESGGVALGCDNIQLTQCTMVNFLQVTIFDPDTGDARAQVVMNASSEPDSDFPCDDLLGVINSGAAAADVDPLVAGALALVQVVCDASEGS